MHIYDSEERPGKRAFKRHKMGNGSAVIICSRSLKREILMANERRRSSRIWIQRDPNSLMNFLVPCSQKLFDLSLDWKAASTINLICIKLLRLKARDVLCPYLKSQQIIHHAVCLHMCT